MPLLHLVRHGEGEHNLTGTFTLPDPQLTAGGETQCAPLRAAFPYRDKVKVFASSPMRRAIQTCIHAFGTPVVALDVLQETSDAPMDVGSSIDALREQFGDSVDLSLVSPGWTDKTKDGEFSPDIDKVLVRAQKAREVLKELAAHGDVVAVSHGGFLHFLTDDWEGVSLQKRSTWGNCEYRSYDFVDGNGVELRETDESRGRRAGRRLSVHEREKWRNSALKELAPHMWFKG